MNKINLLICCIILFGCSSNSIHENCDDAKLFINDVKKTLQTYEISYKLVEGEYVNEDEVTLLKLTVLLEQEIENSNLNHYFLEMFSHSCIAEPVCAKQIIFASSSNFEKNGYKFSPNTTNLSGKYLIIDNFVAFCINNRLSTSLNYLDVFCSEFNESLQKEDRISFSFGFCGLMSKYVEATDKVGFNKFMDGLTIMLVLSKADDSVRSIIDCVYKLSGRKPVNWSAIEQSVNNSLPQLPQEK